MLKSIQTSLKNQYITLTKAENFLIELSRHKINRLINRLNNYQNSTTKQLISITLPHYNQPTHCTTIYICNSKYVCFIYWQFHCIIRKMYYKI